MQTYCKYKNLSTQMLAIDAYGGSYFGIVFGVQTWLL